MTCLAFTIPGEPRGKGRPKFVRATGRTYTDAKTASYENLVKLAACEALAGRAPITCACRLNIVIRMAPAASATKKHRAEMLGGFRAPTKKPDIDNVAKAVLDGLNGVAFVDDVLVIGLSVFKTYAETPGVDVRVIPIASGGPV